jgi:uncharacterized protein with PQ loop repeat
MEMVTIIGSTGALFILIAFVMAQIHRWKDTDLIYDVFNLIGSFLLVVYAILLMSYPFIVLNLVWFTVSARDVILGVRDTSGK